MNATPLRYPGGKSVMTSFIEEIILVNSLKDVVYVEPYAGGAGAAINLLLNSSVRSIKINDISKGIFSFWFFLVNDDINFLKLVEKTSVNIDEWKKQRTIFFNSSKPSLELGFSAFFLSRTNRSGILNAGPIGGNSEIKQEKAKYKIDCRFNKDVLIKKLKRIIKNKENIDVSNHDALYFLKTLKGFNNLVYLDPPYYHMGKELYHNYYSHLDHLELSNFLKNTNDFNWLLSYDNVYEIQKLYSGYPLYEFSLTYTAQHIKKGSELLTHTKNISFPEFPKIKRKDNNIEINVLDKKTPEQ